MKRMCLYQPLILALFFIASQSFAQNSGLKHAEKSKTGSPWRFIIPSTLISYGIITNFFSVPQNFDRNINDKVLRSVHRSYLFDNYTQYLPYAGIYIPDLCGIRLKHKMIDRTFVMGASIIICTGAVQLPKYFTAITRPDGSNNRSFPSGHTATAFLGAHILYREYKEISPWVGIAGYGTAGITGILRVINHKHWFSDVIAGAGVGIISAELAYLMLPVWHKLLKSDDASKTLTINPSINQNSLGFNVVRMF
jgi:membrane-associated phospholipid phosphatase